MSTADHVVALEAGRRVLARGRAPLPTRLKVPWDVERDEPLRDWEKLQLTADNLGDYYRAGITGCGVRLGEASRGLVDVDLDCPEAIAAAPMFLPPTGERFGRSSAPRSHWIYTSDPLVDTSKFAEPATNGGKLKILAELRATGCQTVWPDSAHESGERVRYDDDGEPARVDGPTLLRAVRQLAACALLARAWPKAPGGRHDLALALAGFMLRGGLDESDTANVIGTAARVAGDDEFHDRAVAVRTTAEALRRGRKVIGGPTLVGMLPEPIVGKLADWLELRQQPKVDAAADGAITPSAEKVPPRFPLLSGDAILSIPPPDWLVGKLLQRESLAVLFGAPGTGKSFVALDLALHLAAGIDWHGVPVECGPVIYAATEGASGLGIRCRAWCEWHVRPMPMAFYLLADVPDLFNADTDVIALEGDIRAQLGDQVPVLIVIDTLARVMPGGDENANCDMGLVVARCGRLQRAFGCTVKLVHHTTKADAERERGATALRGAADTMLLIANDGESLTLSVSKQKNAAEAAPLALELHPVPLEGVDGGSCVIRPAPMRTSGQGVGRHATALMEILTGQFDGRVAATPWKAVFQAKTGRSDPTFWRAHGELKRAGQIQRDGRVWVAAVGELS